MARTVGVEEEFLLVGTGSADLRAAGDPVAADADRRSTGQFEHELMREQAELGSAPHDDVTALADDLRRRRTELGRSAAEHGVRLLASGTSPTAAAADDATITDDDRYRRLGERFGETARSALSCGMHVHVGVDSRDEGVRVLNGIRAWLPVLLAVSANSPFLAGRDTGHQSYRSVIWQQWPTAGPAGVFADAAEYDAGVRALVTGGAALDEAGVYFDARLSVRYPTVEVRVADVCVQVDDAVAVAALCRVLVDAAADGRLPVAHGIAARVETVRAGTWRAARYGVEGTLLHPALGTLVPAWDLVDEVEALAAGGIVGLTAIRGRGTGSRLQRDVYARTGSLAAVVDAVAEQTLA